MTPIEQIKATIRCDEYIGRYVKIKNGKALCPFHNEKRPSFSVHRDFYKCFGCPAGGDLIDFVAEYHEVSKGEAIRMLADEAGILLARQEAPRAPSEARTLAAEAATWWNLRRAGLVGLRNHLWDADRDATRVEAILEAHLGASRAEIIDYYRRVRTPWLGEQMRLEYEEDRVLLENIKAIL